MDTVELNNIRKQYSLDFLKSYQRRRILEAEPEEFDGQTMAGVALSQKAKPFEENLVRGEIRLLSQAEELTYVVLLRRWERDSFVVAPFSHYSFPATEEELLIPDAPDYLRVLQIWNIRTVHDCVLQKTWRIGSLAENVRQQAWKLWEFTLGGARPSGEILALTGLPIWKPEDPRLEYKKREMENLAELDRREEEALESLEPMDWDSIGTLFSRQPESMAAAELEGVVARKFLVEETPCLLRISCDRSTHNIAVKVYDAENEPTDCLEGWLLKNAAGEVLCRLKGKSTLLESVDFDHSLPDGTIQLYDEDGDRHGLRGEP